nr:hypothetical protein [Vibrio parahaemolyticus]
MFRKLNDFIFHQVSLRELVENYKSNYDVRSDKSGKKLYKLIDSELRERNKSRGDIVEIVVQHLLENNRSDMDKLVVYLKETLE